ncbi:unnamed protein product [Psylliodes chrysocephalus]|uniref:Uncharacterized protein n=1 Tax=Psylliodes chrysocephalus TaxID=3402493 RepID=A0A9P0GCA0_9CUCU|nr:unnamed protein product [Psylliodes chrysocephala]
MNSDSSSDDTDEDEMILEMCKELKIKLPAKKLKQEPVKQNTTFELSNLENVDINNLPILILPPNEAITNFSGFGSHTSPQILGNNYLNNIAEEVIILVEEEQSSVVIEDRVIETSKTQHIEEVSKKPTEEVLNEQPGILSEQEVTEARNEKERDLTNQIVVDGLREEEQNGNQEVAVDAEEANENENNLNEEFCGDLNSKRKRKSKGLKSKNAENEWTKNKCKKLRLDGKQYMGYRRDSKQKKFKVLHDVIRPARKIGSRCSSEF